jgi:type VI secretion system protein ImpE
MKIDATLAEMMGRVTAACRAAPGDASLRMQMFRLLCVTGQWQRAATALDVAGQTDASLALTVLAYRNALDCERFRVDVFAGRRAPLFAGEPDMGSVLLAQALTLSGAAASETRAKALDLIPAVPGLLNNLRFDWIADADARLGPIFEVYLDGKYFWVPFAHVASLQIEAPDDVLDLVWCRAELTLRGGDPRPVLIPTRYPGSEAAPDDASRLARRTDWTEIGPDQHAGMGQRMLATDAADAALLDCRLLEFD